MSVLQIYFIIAGAILLAKFLYGICTFNRLKRFVNEKREEINILIKNGSLKYSDLVIYHFSENSIKYSDYSEEMIKFMIQGGSTSEIAIYFFIALFWIISIPSIFLCMLWSLLEKAFDKFSKSILS